MDKRCPFLVFREEMLAAFDANIDLAKAEAILTDLDGKVSRNG